VAAIWDHQWLESLHEWRLGFLFRSRLFVRFDGPLGLDSLSLWKLDVRERLWLGLDSKRYPNLATDTQNRTTTCRIPSADSSRSSQNISRNVSRAADYCSESDTYSSRQSGIFI
jgi:hypothetical protein